MPKNWLMFKDEIENLYIFNGHTLEDVRTIIKSKHCFDASVRSYRMKLEEWGFRKNKTCKSVRNQSSENSVIALYGNPSRSSESFVPTPPNENSHPEHMERFMTLASQDPFDYPIFSAPNPPQKSLFDLIDSHAPRETRLILTKALLMVSFDVFLSTPASSLDFQRWCKACREPIWNLTKKKLWKMNLTWLSPGAAKLVLEAALPVIGERSLAVHKAQLDHGHRLKSPDFKFEVYDYHRSQYMEILRDFREWNVELEKQWYVYLLDLMEWEARNDGSSNEDGVDDDGDDESDVDFEMSEGDEESS
ncbi:uncharacterized protein PAC_09974 [Phialocephala subalpina]|uniref:Clr5 domain-containing protein n=1 Tax=Phialocephala subalpina TaxID=576137 RepID=A0A1L7X4Y1_9HELO|nr:uncharacterized protein PAC_09974 [Phialocephala subalpina]